MQSFEIFVDSAANIPDNLRISRNIKVVPFLISVNGEEVVCGQDAGYSETAKAFYEQMRLGADVRTSLISESNFSEAIAPSLEAGKDAIIITMASGISGTYQQAVAAQKALEKQFPSRKVVAVDSANASLGEGLLALKVADLRDMGESLETCVEWLKNNTYKMNSFLTVDDLKYMRRGGRISRTVAIAGTLLSIKPVLTADGGTNAKIVSHSKVHGRKKAISALVEAFDNNVVRPEMQTVAIAHCDCEEEALALAKTIKEHGAREVIVEYYDMCSGAHVGPGTIALFFMGKDRKSQFALPALQPQGKTVPNAR